MATAPPMSATATTRIPAEWSRYASGPPTFPNPWMTARLPAMGSPSSTNAARAHTRQPDDVAPAWARVPPTATRLAGDRAREVVALGHRQRVHQPGHHATVGVDVRGGHVAVGSEQGADLERVPAGQPLELVEGERRRVAPNAALGPSEGQVEDRGLERHRAGERLHLVDVDVGVEADAALAGTAGRVVVDPPPREHLDRAVVHADGHRDLEHPFGRAQEPMYVGVEPGELRSIVESVEHGLPGVGGHGWVPLVGSVLPDGATDVSGTRMPGCRRARRTGRPEP